MDNEKAPKTMKQVKDEYFLHIYEQTGKNKALTAKTLGMTVKSVYNTLEKMGLYKATPRSQSEAAEEAQKSE